MLVFCKKYCKQIMLDNENYRKYQKLKFLLQKGSTREKTKDVLLVINKKPNFHTK